VRENRTPGSVPGSSGNRCSYGDGSDSGMGTRFWLFAMALVLSACAPNSQVEERKQYWAGEANAFFQVGRTMDQVHPWLRELKVYYTYDDGDIVDGNWTVSLEKIYTETFRCEWVDIRLHLAVDNSQRVLGYFLDDAGPCLW